MEQELRRMFEMKKTEMTVPATLPPELRKRVGRQRMVMGGLATAAALAVVLGGFAGARSLTRDDAPVPPAEKEKQESAFIDTWVNTDLDASAQTMVIRASGEDTFEIVVRDASARVCSGAPSTMTGTGRLNGAGELVIPSPAYTCDDGSEPKVESGPPLEQLLRDFTFVHDRETDTLTDSFDLVWGRGKAPQHVPETEVAAGVYEGTPWQLSVFTAPGTSSEGLYLRGYLGDEIFAGFSGISLDSELEGLVAGGPVGRPGWRWALTNGLQDALVVFGTVSPDITRVEFSEGGETLSADTIAVPAELGDDFRVFALFAPFGTKVDCWWGDVPTVNCFGQEQRIVGLDAAGEIVTEEVLHPEASRSGLFPEDRLRYEPDPDEFVTDGSESGLSWRLSARRYEPDTYVTAPAPSWSWRCFAFALAADPQDLVRYEGELPGGLGCLNRPGAGWFGEVGQRVEPQRPEVAPVYGAIPTEVDDVSVLLDDGSEIPAQIYRHENHPIAYYLAWIPDAYATGSVRFSADGTEVGSRSLCAADYRDKDEGFVCYGTPESE